MTQDEINAVKKAAAKMREENSMQAEVIEMAAQAGLFKDYGDGQGSWLANDKGLERFAKLVAAAEREACAKVCEDMERYGHWITKKEAAAAIRARGEATSPQTAQRTWVGLTDEEQNECVDTADEAAINNPLIFWSEHHYDAIEAKLKEKNT